MRYLLPRLCYDFTAQAAVVVATYGWVCVHMSVDMHRRRHLHASRVAADFYSCFRLERSLRSLSVFFSIWSFVARIVLIESSKGIWAVVSCYSLML